jgi:hypothetical protein
MLLYSCLALMIEVWNGDSAVVQWTILSTSA